MSRREDAQAESLAIPAGVRLLVDTRDHHCCRVCGRFLGERRALHHIRYGGDQVGMGGRRKHLASEIVTVCWLPGDGDCHAIVHSDKAVWQSLLLEVVKRNGITARQLQRWGQRRPAARTSVAPTGQPAADGAGVRQPGSSTSELAP